MNQPPLKTLILGKHQMTPQAQKEMPKMPKFFHFDGVPASSFHSADIILFRQEGKPDIVMKDRFGTMDKK